MHTGVPQGAVSSPLLFNFYVSDMPKPPLGIQKVSYADDTTIGASGPAVQPLSNAINNYLPSVLEFLEGRRLKVSPEKSTVTLFTPHSAQANEHPQILINGQLVPLVRQPKILGVVHDTMYCFKPHCDYTMAKTQARNNVLKALSGSSWGHQKETMLMTYKAIGRSVLEYGVPIWAPVLSESGWKRLQCVQNAALRICCGCHIMADSTHLHVESKVLPVREHAEMVSKQYLLTCTQRDHPCHNILDAPDPPRNMKNTLMSKFRGVIQRLVPTGVCSKRESRAAQKIVHTESVQATITSYGPSKVLGAQPPPVDITELTLNRSVRSTLAQLRSGYCKLLQSYQARIHGQADLDRCPDCGATPHDVSHLFNCTSNPTTYTTLDLWNQPVGVAGFLRLQ